MVIGLCSHGNRDENVTIEIQGGPKKESMEFVIHMYSKEMVIHRSVFTLQRYEKHEIINNYK